MVDYSTHFDIAYPEQAHPRQALDLYLPTGASGSSPLIVFIHGGAWRAESKADVVNTLAPALVNATGCPVAVLDYRHAPVHPHPAQISDVILGLDLLASPAALAAEGGSPKWDRRKLYLVGHSAGAFMSATVVLDPPGSDVVPAVREFDVANQTREAVAGIVCVDGIYDLVDLIDEYPDYDGFVHDAFGLDKERLWRESPSHWALPPKKSGERKLNVLVLHSREDELLTLRQSEGFVRQVKTLFEREGEGRGTLEVDYDSLKDSHDNLIKRQELPTAVAAWVKALEAK